jgi:hypothetical protein
VGYAATTVPTGDLVGIAHTSYRESIISTESGSYATVNKKGREKPQVTLPPHRSVEDGTVVPKGAAGYEWALGRYQYMEATLFGLTDAIAAIRPGYDLKADQNKNWVSFRLF